MTRQFLGGFFFLCLLYLACIMAPEDPDYVKESSQEDVCCTKQNFEKVPLVSMSQILDT